MYINSNSGATQAAQYLGSTTNNLNQTMAELSSGLSITSAADNPAGLAISNEMQTQINGESAAYQNAAQGTSLLQTGSGALSQIQNILQSMYSLATQAANSTNVGVDRGSIQSQMNQYTKEIDSITNQTTFNTKNLLDGVLGTVNLATGADPNQELSFSLGAFDAVSLGVAGQQPISAVMGTTTAPSGAISGLSLFGASSTTNPYGSYGLTGTNYNIALTAASGPEVNGTAASSATASPSASTAVSTEGSIAAGGIVYTGATSQSLMVQVTTSSTGTLSGVSYSTNGGTSYQAATTDASGNYVLGTTGATVVKADITANTTDSAVDTYTLNLTPASATFQLESSNGASIGSSYTIKGMSATNQSVTLGNANDGEAIGFTYNAAAAFSLTAGTDSNGTVPTTGSNDFAITYATNQAATGSGGTVQQNAVVNSGLSVMNYAQATSTQTALQAALTQVAAGQAQMGSLMDSLNQASQDLQTSQSNLTDAQSGIQDVNVAQASAALAEQQVQQQAGVAMLATANQTPQALLKLLP